MNTIRTFIAIDVGDDVRDRAADLARRLQVAGADVKWVDTDNMHLTLKFLGDIPDRETAEVCRAVSEAAQAHSPFNISLRGAGAFPNAARPRTVWMGVERGVAELESFQTGIEKALAKLGYRKEARRFHPHLTLGRVRRGGAAVRDLGRLIRDNEQFDGASASINKVLVFASFLDKTGPTYNVLGRAPLGH